jgi:hypothetical protein
MRVMEALGKVIEAAREATCDTHNIPACVELGKALYAYDKARGAICPVCDGAGSIDDPDDDECDPGEGPTCTGPCGGTGLVEPNDQHAIPTQNPNRLLDVLNTATANMLKEAGLEPTK